MVLLDTSFLVELEAEVSGRRVGPARRFLGSRGNQAAALSIVSVAEVAEGFSSPVETEAFLRPFRVLQLSRSIAYRAAYLQAALDRRLGENDAWIAATALAYEAELVGRDRAFSRIPRLHYTAI